MRRHDAKGEQCLGKVRSDRVVVADNRQVIGALNRVNVVNAVLGLTVPGFVMQGLPGNQHIMRSEFLAAVPVHIVNQVVGDVHGSVVIHYNAAVFNGGNLSRQDRLVLHVAVGNQQALNDHCLNVAHQVSCVNIHGVRFKGHGDNQFAALSGGLFRKCSRAAEHGEHRSEEDSKHLSHSHFLLLLYSHRLFSRMSSKMVFYSTASELICI